MNWSKYQAIAATAGALFAGLAIGKLSGAQLDAANHWVEIAVGAAGVVVAGGAAWLAKARAKDIGPG